MFTEELRAEIEIDPTPERVWEALTEFDAFPAWNPFITSIEGELALGAKLKARLEPPGGKGFTMKPTVTAFEPGRSFGWLGNLIVPGVFDGAHRFDLEPIAGGRTRLVQSEHFRGVVVPLFRRSLRAHTLRGFEEMNHALEARAQAAA